MSLSRRIAVALDEPLAPGTGQPGTISAEEAPHRLTLAVQAANPVGVEVVNLAFSDTDPDRPERSLDDLKAWADRVATRVTYLMEPLVLLEVDSQGGEAELRSQKPTTREGRRTFYEVRLNRQGTLRIVRVAFDEADRSRREISFQLTREVLERLADDLVATAG